MCNLHLYEYVCQTQIVIKIAVFRHITIPFRVNCRNFWKNLNCSLDYLLLNFNVTKKIMKGARTLSNQKTLDPFSFWKDYYRNVESYLGEAIDEKMRTDEFSEWMGNILDVNLLYKQMADKTTKQYLEQMNLPSRDDLANLSSLIVNLDTKVDDLEEKVEENIDAQISQAVVKKELTQLKKDVKDIGTKLDEVLQYMKASQKVTSSNEKGTK